MRKLFAGKVKSFAKDEKGASMVEYAVLVGLIAAIAIATVRTVGTDALVGFTNTKTSLEAAGLKTGN
jgi:pilus assembly protein Flp/PilA